MNILIITSHDHIYANYFLRMAFGIGLFKNHRIVIWEQDAIVPGKSTLEGLKIYLMKAGFYYVAWQGVKQILFKIITLLHGCMVTWLNGYMVKWFINRNDTHQQAQGIINQKNVSIVAWRDKLKRSIYFPYWLIEGFVGERKTYGNIKSDEAFERVRELNPDIIISVFSKEIIPKRILQIPKLGAINLHPAYLPTYRGVSPIFWSMANGEKYTGSTLHYLDPGIDTGGIIARKKVAINGYKTEHSMYIKLVEEGFELFKNYWYILNQKSKIKNQNYQNKNNKNNMKIVNNKLLTLKSKEKPSYFSIPTREAVGRFLRNGYRFF